MMTFEFLPEYDIDHASMSSIEELIMTAFDDRSASNYYGQCPQLRLLCSDEGRIIAHTALYHRSIAIGPSSYMIFGIADHCVNKAYRDQGLGRTMVHKVIDYAGSRPIDFLLVMAHEPKYYSAMGFTPITANCRWLSIHSHRSLGVLRRPIADGLMYRGVRKRTWPSGEVDLLGPMI